VYCVDIGPDGFSSFYEASYSRVAGLVAAMLGDRHQAEDITQEAFARALARRGHIGAPEVWVRRAAQRLAIDAGRPAETRSGDLDGAEQRADAAAYTAAPAPRPLLPR